MEEFQNEQTSNNPVSAYTSDSNVTKQMQNMAAVSQYIALAMKKDDHQNLIKNLPISTKKKISALRNLQIETTKVEAEFHKALYEMERTFQTKHEGIFKKRMEIVNGEYVPTDEECVCKIPVHDAGIEINPGIDQTKGVTLESDGIPNFWLNIFKYAPLLDTMVKDFDEPILKHLVDVRVVTQSLPDMSFILQFCFSPNEYFSDEMLTKEYIMQCTPEADNPFTFDGPEIYNAKGCTIHWLPNKDVTAKQVISRKVELPRSIKLDSFFNFFDSIVVPEDATDPKYDEMNESMQYDFEIGYYIKDKIIPRAVLYYTGEIIDEVDSSEVTSSSDGEGDENTSNIIDVDSVI